MFFVVSFIILSIVFYIFNKKEIMYLFLLFIICLLVLIIQHLFFYIVVYEDRIELNIDYVEGPKGTKLIKNKKKKVINYIDIEKVVTTKDYSLVSIEIKDNKIIVFRLSGCFFNERKDILESLPNINIL